MSDRKDLSRMIKEILSARPLERIQDGQGTYKHAGVLIPLLVEEGLCTVLFTKRTDKVEHHKGQISFPGGAVDDEDSSVEETVLREAFEEIGLLKEYVEILGRIDDTLTMVSNFIVHPFVGLIRHPYDFSINTVEVERLIEVPLSVFDTEYSKTKRYTVEFDGMTYEMQAYKYDDDLIWGATARIMDNFMNVIGHELLLHGKKK